jgi:hypothetical protein
MLDKYKNLVSYLFVTDRESKCQELLSLENLNNTTYCFQANLGAPSRVGSWGRIQNT